MLRLSIGTKVPFFAKRVTRRPLRDQIECSRGSLGLDAEINRFADAQRANLRPLVMTVYPDQFALMLDVNCQDCLIQAPVGAKLGEKHQECKLSMTSTLRLSPGTRQSGGERRWVRVDHANLEPQLTYGTLDSEPRGETAWCLAWNFLQASTTAGRTASSRYLSSERSSSSLLSS